MNIFNKRSASGLLEVNDGLEPFITASAEVNATVSGRVSFHSQNTQFEADPDSTLIALIIRANAEDLSKTSKKGFHLVFDKNIKSGTYPVTDSNFPFTTAEYFETGTIPGFTTSFSYKAKSGSFSVETIESSESKLHYEISFNFKGATDSEELKIEGKATFIVLMRSLTTL
ncbi:hypothetical protein ACYZTR_06295 [Pseudomonas sp. Hz4]